MLLVFGILRFVFTRGTGEIRRCGQTFQFPVPYASIQLRSSENSTTFFTVGYPDLKGVFSSRGGRFGWGEAYQGGSAFSIFSTQNERLSMTALIELRTTDAAEVEFVINECGSRACVLPLGCPRAY